MVKYVYFRDNAQMVIVNPSPEADLELIKKKDIPQGVSYFTVEDDWAPDTSRRFRDAWTMDGVDMARAREIHRDRLRKMRKPMLNDLDVEYMKALEASDNSKLQEITKKKQALRDVTTDKLIEDAKTPDELEAAIPAALK